VVSLYTVATRANLMVGRGPQVGVDHLLTAVSLDATEADLFLLNNGCLCCTVRSDLAPMIERLYQVGGRAATAPAAAAAAAAAACGNMFVRSALTASVAPDRPPPRGRRCTASSTGSWWRPPASRSPTRWPRSGTTTRTSHGEALMVRGTGCGINVRGAGCGPDLPARHPGPADPARRCHHAGALASNYGGVR
jgi:hypothetical protein